MADFGKAGGMESASPAVPHEGGTPVTGYSSAPKGEFATFSTPPGIGGSGRGAH